MRKRLCCWVVFVVAIALIVAAVPPEAIAAGKMKKYDVEQVDARHKQWGKKEWTTSTAKINWRMSDCWGGILNRAAVLHFCDSVRAASGGRLNITPFPTGAIVGANEIFDAVSKGTLDAGHTFPGYWKGKSEAFNLFASIPYGMDTESMTVWYYQGEGKKMMEELYGQFNLVPFFMGNGGQELGLFSKKKAETMADYKGMKVRTVGWYMDILTQAGVSVVPLPGPEVYLGLERGVIDAAEFSCPAITYPMGFHEVGKYILSPGVHQPTSQLDLIINKNSWSKLPDDLKAIVEICAAETNQWYNTLCQFMNIEAIELLKKDGAIFTKMDDGSILEFRKVTKEYLDGLKAKYPEVKKILESQEKFLVDIAPWREMKSGVSPWPYEDFMKGKRFE